MIKKNAISKFLVIAALLSVTAFPVNAYGMDENTELLASCEQDNCEHSLSEYSITPRAEIRTYSYTRINGYCFRRLWSNTFCYWVDDEWSVCPSYSHNH